MTSCQHRCNRSRLYPALSTELLTLTVLSSIIFLAIMFLVWDRKLRGKYFKKTVYSLSYMGFTFELQLGKNGNGAFFGGGACVQLFLFSSLSAKFKKRPEVGIKPSYLRRSQSFEKLEILLHFHKAGLFES